MTTVNLEVILIIFFVSLSLQTTVTTGHLSISNHLDDFKCNFPEVDAPAIFVDI